MTTDANSLIALANGLQRIADPLTALRVQIYLLQQIAGGSFATETAQQLITAVSGQSPGDYQRIDNGLLARRIIVYLLTQINTSVGTPSLGANIVPGLVTYDAITGLYLLGGVSAGEWLLWTPGAHDTGIAGSGSSTQTIVQATASSIALSGTNSATVTATVRVLTL